MTAMPGIFKNLKLTSDKYGGNAMKLMVLDGNSIINRSFYAIRLLTTSDGLFTNAVYGFITTLQKLLDEDSPDALCVAFDMHAPTFRHSLYDKYKATRKAMPEELAVQLPLIRQVLRAMKIPIYELEGYEADDLVGTIAAVCSGSGWDCVIVTGDRDNLQLIDDRVHVKLVSTYGGKSSSTEYDEEAFIGKYGFRPENIVDLKALMGDSSDNIPGVAGVGEKTATELIRRFKTLEGVYENLDSEEIKPAVRKKLEEGRESAFMSYRLATIDKSAPLDFKPEDCIKKEPDREALYELFTRLEFTRLLEKFNLSKAPSETGQTGAAAQELRWTRPKSSEELSSLCAMCKTSEYVVFIASKSLNMLSIVIDNDGYLVNSRDIEHKDYIEFLKAFFGRDVRKISHDVKSLMTVLLGQGIDFDDFIYDTALAAYLLNPNEAGYTLQKTAENLLGLNLPDNIYDRVDNSVLSGMDSDLSDALKAHAPAVRDLYLHTYPKLAEHGMEELYYSIEMPLCRVLAEMEHTGFAVDRAQLSAFGKTLGDAISVLQQDIYRLAGGEFNINSTKQLGHVLFDILGLPVVSKTKTGVSTNIEVLEKLADKHPIIEKLIEYRQLTKLKSTYADGLMKVISPDGRIRTSFNMTATATGRLSSTEPNLQNIPVRTELGGELRKMFVAGEGCLLIDADYSQIELRLLAHISSDPVMASAFKAGEDIHRVTASQVFGVGLQEVTPLQRSRAKAVNFGIVYGISDFSLAQDIKVSRHEARQYIDSYLSKYSGVRRYMKDIVEKAKKDGYVSTVFGRRRYLPELNSKNHNIRSFGERVALNMPIQGTAADIIKLAMVRVSNRFKKEGLKARLLLQVHDELIAEAPAGEAEKAAAILKEEMESVVRLSVPLVADANIGKSWYDAK